MSYPHFDLVERAYEELLSSGQIQHRSNQEEVEEDKGLLTRRAGYYTNLERDSTIGLLEKTTGNNSQGYSTDILIKTDGTYWDIATDSGGLARPINGGPSDDQNLVSRWRQPTATLASLPEFPLPLPSINPPSIDEKLELLTAMSLTLTTKLDNLIVAEQRMLDTIHQFEARFGQVIEDMEATLTRILPLITCNYKPLVRSR